MNNKIIGIVLIVLGVALALWVNNVFDSAGAQIGRAFSGNTPIEAWLAMVGRVICIAMGFSKVINILNH
jgi:heme/copper-type cytochrome/quinol oxidase subunit 2